MMENRTILCFASGYDAPPTSKHHVMHLLAERNTVLWVNYHASRAPSASSSDLRYMLLKLKQVFSGMSRPKENLHVLTPLVVPLPASKAARWMNRKLLVFQVRRALRRIGQGGVDVWSFTPDISYLLGRFGEERVVYYCVDEHSEFTGYDRDQVLRDERELCEKADLVITTSLALQEAKKSWNPHTALVTHGVDYEHFAGALSEQTQVPADLEVIPRPRLGFFGLIRDWVNLEVLAETARKRPEWHFVFLGDSTVDLSGYREITNMHFLGRKPYSTLPGYCRGFDVGLIPFQRNALTEAVNPIKLREYLAAGLPVISTPLPEVKLYADRVHLAETVQEFEHAAEAALQEGPEARRRRSEAMRTESWEGKMESILRYLEEGAPRGSGRPVGGRGNG